MTETKKSTWDKTTITMEEKGWTPMIKKIPNVNRKLTLLWEELAIIDRHQKIKKIPQFKKLSFNLWTRKI